MADDGKSEKFDHGGLPTMKSAFYTIIIKNVTRGKVSGRKIKKVLLVYSFQEYTPVGLYDFNSMKGIGALAQEFLTLILS